MECTDSQRSHARDATRRAGATRAERVSPKSTRSENALSRGLDRVSRGRHLRKRRTVRRALQRRLQRYNRGGPKILYYWISFSLTNIPINIYHCSPAGPSTHRAGRVRPCTGNSLASLAPQSSKWKATFLWKKIE